MFPVARLHLKHLALWALPLVGLACGGDGSTDVVLPPLTITTATTGAEIDSDGYNVSIDGQAVQAIGSNTSLTINQVAAGEHTVELSGIAGNCVVGGPNPQTVSVVQGVTATSAFAITCSAGIGSIQVVTATTGAGTDPDGFALLLDGTDHGAIAVSATSRLTGLAPGSHSIGLTGLAGNCQISGENPRTVPVSAGGTAEVAFAIICAAPDAVTGSLVVTTVTTGPEQDADGYLISIDGGAGQPIATSASMTLSNLTAVLHTVELQALAPNCGVTGNNPLGVAIEPGETAQVSFAVTCAATVGSLAVTIAGLPSGANGAVVVSGPNGFSQQVIATGSLTGLTPGTYTISASNVVSGGTTYTASVSNAAVTVAAGASPTVTVSYTRPEIPTLNLRVQSSYITQSTQKLDASVPLVSGRAGFLRVFVLANESNSAKPTVRVIFHNGSSTTTHTINAPGNSTPTSVQEGSLGSSWNLAVAAELIRPGLSVEIIVDPGASIAESNEGDNRTTKTLTVQTVPAARIRFVSVQQGSSAPGNVSAANKDQLMDMTRRMYPLKDIDTDVDPAVFTASVPLEANGNGWNQLLSDLEGKRADEGTNRTYYGVVKVGYERQDGMVGLTLGAGLRTAAGWDDAGDAPRVVAHELGHTWGRRHTVCGGPPAGTIDQLYPYPDGQIGANGLDVANTAAKPVSSPDIMGYCFENPWVSDYTYRGVMDFRQANSSVVLAGASQPSLLVWGRIVNGRPVLEPAFQIVTRPSLPRRPGPYTVTATAGDGTQVFALSFDAAHAEDGPQGSRHFAFAVPLSQAQAARLASLRLNGPGGMMTNSRSAASLRLGVAGAAVTSRREGQSVVLQWNASVHPTILVRDPDTGNVLSFARGGNARVWTSKDYLDLELSDGVRSQRVRLAINRS